MADQQYEPFSGKLDAAPEFVPFDGTLDGEKPKPRGAIRAMADLGVGVASGVVGVSKAAANVAGAGNTVSNVLDSADKTVQGWLSPQAQADQQEIAAHMSDAKAKGLNLEGVKAGAKAFATAPGQFAAQAVGSAAPFIASALTGPLLPTALGVAVGMGTSKGAIYDEIKKRGGTEEEAIKAQEYGGPNKDQIALGGALGVADALTGVAGAGGRMLRGALRKPVANAAVDAAQPGAIRRMATGVASEAPLEAVQGGQEQIAANLAAQRAGYQAGTFDNVASNATLEALASAGPGAAFGALEGGAKRAEPTVEDTTGGLALAGDQPPEAAPVLDPATGGVIQKTYDPRDPNSRPPLAIMPKPEGIDYPEQVKPSARMGIDPAAGPISSAAALAVDSGAHQQELDIQAAEIAQTGSRNQPGQSPLGSKTGKGQPAGQTTPRKDQPGQEGQTNLFPSANGTPSAFKSYEEAQSYITEQKKRGTSIQALPLPQKDGSYSMAMKGTADYTIAEFHKKQMDMKAAGVLDGDILTKSGDIFAKKAPAVSQANKAGAGHVVVPVQGGFVIRKQEVSNVSKPTTVPAGTGASVSTGGADGVRGVVSGATAGNGDGVQPVRPEADNVGAADKLPAGVSDSAVAKQPPVLDTNAQAATETIANVQNQAPRDTNPSRDPTPYPKRAAGVDKAEATPEAGAKAPDTALPAAGTGAVEAAGLSDQLEDALFKERDATTSAIENDWMKGNGRRRLTNIERSIYDAVTASTLDADSAAQIIETALENDRPDLAQYAASRAMRAAESMDTTPGVPQSSPKYGKIKSDLEASKKQALDAASALQEIVNSKQAPQAADVKAITAKQIPAMTDVELQQAIEHYGPESIVQPATKTVAQPTEKPSDQAPKAEQSQTQPEAGKTAADIQPAASPGVGGTSQAVEPVKPKNLREKIDQARQARADYFKPGNIVKSYGGHDEVLSYTEGENGSWTVKVHAVKKVGDQWIRQGKPQDARQHSTQPDAKQLKAGPVAVLPSQAAQDVVYSEPRADGQPFPNAVPRGTPVEVVENTAPAPAKSAQTATKDVAENKADETGMFQTKSEKAAIEGKKPDTQRITTDKPAPAASDAVLDGWWGNGGISKDGRNLTALGRTEALASIGYNAPVMGAKVRWAYLPEQARQQLAAMHAQGWEPAAAPAPTAPISNVIKAAQDSGKLQVINVGDKPAAKAALTEQEKAAKAKMLAAAGNLATLLSKNTRANITPEQEQAMLPIVIELFEGAMELGYVKFKQAARYVREFIAQAIDQDAADSIPMDTLQGAYIATSGRHKDKGVTPKKEVAGFESLAELEIVEENADTVGKDEPNADPGPTPASEPVTGSTGVQDGKTGKLRKNAGSVRRGNAKSNTGNASRGTVKGAPPDFVAAPGGLTREGSWFETAKRNLDLIDLAIKIDAEKRAATPEEQAQLAKYVGFGASAIRNELFPVPPAYAKAQEPNRLIWPQYVRNDRFKPLAERMEALPREWQQSILQSSQYAHYTSEGIIRSIWSALGRMGFKGGQIFEPGMGIGSFSMLMPDSVRADSRYTGVEFDAPTALIAKLLSPQQNMLHGDFIKGKYPKNFFDVNVGNPPFSQTKIFGDPEYAKKGFMLHDFFFAKGIDLVRPGGIQVFVTSKGTMDKQNDKARKYLADRADLLGVIRLPSTAFEDNAGTSVVTDVIFLKKREPGAPAAGEAWAGTATVDTPDGPVVVNEYFAKHPEMVLGQQRISGNTDDQGRRINRNGMGGEKYTVVSYDTTPAELDAKFATAIEKLPKGAYSEKKEDTVAKKDARVDFDPTVKREGVVYLAKDGSLMRVSEGVGVPLANDTKLSDKDQAWFKSYVGLRDLVQEARFQQLNEGDWEAALAKLNKAYDKFVKDHGHILDYRVMVRKSTDEEGNVVETEHRIPKNRRLLREDYDQALVTSLESISEDGSIVKSPFLKSRTIGKPVTRKVTSIGDALAVSLDETGALNVKDVGDRLGLSESEAIEALDKQIYQTPTGQWQLSDEYLSGDVVSKLEEAEAAARINPDLRRNVEALKDAQPEKLGPSQISAKLGASWVPESHVNAFAQEIDSGEVSFDPRTETWQVDGGNLRNQRKAGAEYGTAKRSPSELLEAILNSRSITVKYDSSAGKELAGKTDVEATTAANEAAKKIKEKFKGWVWTDTDRATELVELYNKHFNNIAPRKFDGSHLTLPGVSLRYKLHPHQLRAIWRMVQTGNTYLAHAVGAGKTIEMIAGGMEQKRLGLIKKPIYVVPNHMLEQFSNEFMELYPLANIMVADDENFSAERRKAFVASATLNSPDAIVITHDAFQRIGVKEESVAPIRDEILSDLEIELSETAKGNDTRVRRGQLEQQIEAVKQRFDRIIGAGAKDSTVKFEDMGVDFVFADEAHVFRKLDFHTAQQIKGIDPNGSKRALDMYVKTRILESRKPGRSMAFASGTPVTNTMGELYTIMRFFAGAELDKSGISTFDAWARQFGEVAPALEPNAAGKYELIERFAKFDNVPELMSRVRQFMDVLTSDNLGALVKRPDIEGGKPNLNIIPTNDSLTAYMKGDLAQRIDISRAWKPSKDQPFNPDPIVAIITDGRFAAIDPRFFGGKLNDGDQSIITEMGDRIAKVYHETKNEVYKGRDGKDEPIKGSTQIVFYNLGFGEQSQKSRGFNSRHAFTKRLTDGGIPRAEIAWFDDANSDAKKEAVFKDMRSGKVKVLIGSAKKMGTGVNVQKRLKVLHYQDPPWFPADVEQPHGRILRQGNQNEKIGIEWYTTKGTYQSTMWQMVGRKQRFIDQAFTGDKNMRSMDDLGEASLFEQAAAVASGDPRAIQLAGLRQDVQRFERLQAAHTNEQINVQHSLRSASWQVESLQKKIKGLETAFKAIGERYFAFTAGKVGGREYTKPGEFGQAVKDAFNKVAADAVMAADLVREKEIASIGNAIKITMDSNVNRDGKADGTYDLFVEFGGQQYELSNAAAMGADVDAAGLARRIFNKINGVDSDLQSARRSLASEQTDQIKLRKKLGAPFEYQQEMAEKYGELKRLEAELKAEGEAVPPPAPLVINADGTTNGEAAVQPAKLRKAEASTNLKQTGAPEANESDVVFSRPTFSRSFSPAARSQATDVVERQVARIKSKWKNAPKIIVAFDMADERIPAAVRAEDQRQRSGGAAGTPEGFYYGGTVYLMSSQLKSPGDVQRVLFHEALGHFGLRGTFGDGLKPILQQIATFRKAEVDAKIKEYGLRNVPLDREIAAEEVLAEMAQNTPEIGFVKRAIAMIRTWLRENGFSNLTLTDDEIITQLILPARAFVEQGGKPKNTGGNSLMRSLKKGDWYSELSRQVMANRQQQMPAGMWSSWIDSLKTKGVKPDEIEWSGVQDWLKLQTGKVTKDQITGFLDANGVKVTETVLKDFSPEETGETAKRAELAAMSDEELADEAESAGVDPDNERNLVIDDIIGSYLNDGAENEQLSATKYGQYTLPGGENYREVLLTLPPAQRKARFDVMNRKDKTILKKADSREEAQAWIEANAGMPAAKGAEIIERQTGQPSSPEYKSSHWDQPNILAHIRVNDRVDADGRKVLFIEELQSDFGQQAKKEGFAFGDKDKARLEEVEKQLALARTAGDKYEVAEFNSASGVPEYWVVKGSGRNRVHLHQFSVKQIADVKAYELNRDDSAPDTKALYAERDSLENRKAQKRGVPLAPFVDKTDKWLTLSLKRIVKMAVDGGYAKVAFINGEQSAERYSLAKHIRTLKVKPLRGGGMYAVGSVLHGGESRAITTGEGVPAENLPDLVGKEMAERILADKLTPGEWHDYSDLDLKVGGEGMKTFYDAIVPNATKALLKKLGGGQMESVDITTGNPPQGGPGWGKLGTEGTEKTIGQPGFTITPAMQEKAAGGMPMFSRSTDKLNETLKNITVTDIKARTGNKLADYRGLGLQFLGGRQIVDLYGKDIPQLNGYTQMVQQMSADANEVGAQADKIATGWANLKDERQLAELMHDATLAQIDPAKPLVEGDNPLAYGKLNGLFKALSDDAKKVYREARDAYEEHYAQVRDAIRDKIERSEMSSASKAAMLERMDGEFFDKIKGVYFPLARFGKYVVVTRGPTGVVNVSRAETLNEAQATRELMRKAYPSEKGFMVGKVIKDKEFNASRDAVGRGFLKELFGVLDEKGMGEELQDAVNQLYLASMPDLSWAKHGIHRKGTPGFSQDARRAFAQNMFHGARYLAKLRYADQLADKLTQMEAFVESKSGDESFDQPKARDVLDELVKRHDSLMNPKSNPLSTALTSFGFVFHMGLSPASAIVNLSGTAMVAYPIMGAKWGFDKAATALMKAGKEAATHKNDISQALNADEKRAYDAAVKAGTIDVTAAHDLAGIAQGEDAGVMWKLRPVMKWASFLFHHAERFNRQITFVAAYRLARETGSNPEAAFEQATKATYDGHFDYAASNRPRVMQGPAIKVITLFKQYGQNMVYTLTRQAQQAMNAETPEQRRESRKALAGLLVMHAAGAGVLGLPLVGTLLAAASMIGGSDDEPWDAEVALRNMLADAFGQKPAEVLARGLSRLTPWDISGRVGLDKLILPDIQEGLEGQRLGESVMAAALGPVAGIGINVTRGMQEISEGHLGRGIETMMPAAFRAPLKALRYEMEGAKDKTGVMIKDEVGLAGVAGQALGFSPSEVRNATEGRSAIYAADKRLMARRSELMAQYAQALIGKDTEGVAEAMAEIRTFNEKNPNRRINGMQLAISVKNRNRRVNEAADGVYLPKKRRDMVEEGRFAVPQ